MAAERERAYRKNKEDYDADILSGGNKAEAQRRFEEAEAAADSKYGEKKKKDLNDTIVGALTNGTTLGGLIAPLNNLVSIFAVGGAGVGFATLALKLGNTLLKTVDLGFKKLGEGLERAMSLESSYLGPLNARLRGAGSEADYHTMFSNISEAYGGSKYVNMQNAIEKMAQLVEQGVAFNVEQRSILAELSDRMVSTFNVLDSTLLRLTRLQQEDMTIPMMGYEANLTEFLNGRFKDSSYLSDAYDSVSEALLEASSQMSSEAAAEFQYNVHKWLGSLYSLGMSQSGVMSLAQGIGYLATGDLSNFESGEALRNLLTMSSNGSIADILIGGLNSKNVNTLLENIVTILADISDDTNNVVKKARSEIIGGLNVSDLRSVYNLTTDDVKAIKNNTYSYSNILDTTYPQLLMQAASWTSEGRKIDNAISNLFLRLGEELLGAE